MAIFNFDFPDELKTKVELVAKILDFPGFQFMLYVEGNDALKESIMANNISYYEETLKRLNDLDEKKKLFERAKLQRPILSMSQDEVQKMCERMEDMYYR